MLIRPVANLRSCSIFHDEILDFDSFIAIPKGPKSETELPAERKIEERRLERDRQELALRKAAEEKRQALAEQKRAETDRKVFESQLQRAVQDSAEAQYELALSYLNGTGTEPNREMAIRWLRASAQQNHQGAKLELESLDHQDALANK